MSKRPTRYLQGPATTTAAIINAILASEYVWFLERPIHPSFICNWPIRMIDWHARKGRLRLAVQNAEWKAP